MNATIHDLLGKRCLVKTTNKGMLYAVEMVREVRVEEISPSGNWCRLLDLFGCRDWIPVAGVSLVEELKTD